MISDEGGPIAKNQEWRAAHPGDPIRQIVSELCGVCRTAVGKYLKEHMGGSESTDRLFLGAAQNKATSKYLGNPKCRAARLCTTLSLYRRSHFRNTGRGMWGGGSHERIAKPAPIPHSRRKWADAICSIRTCSSWGEIRQMFFRKEKDKEGTNGREAASVYQ